MCGDNYVLEIDASVYNTQLMHFFKAKQDTRNHKPNTLLNILPEYIHTFPFSTISPIIQETVFFYIKKHKYAIWSLIGPKTSDYKFPLNILGNEILECNRFFVFLFSKSIFIDFFDNTLPLSSIILHQYSMVILPNLVKTNLPIHIKFHITPSRPFLSISPNITHQ